MAYLFQKKVRGQSYWYLGENKKVNGVSRRVWQKYLGTANVIKDRVDGFGPVEVDVLEFGVVAGMLAISEDLDFVSVVNEVIWKREQGLSIGDHLLLTIINRVDEPLSKNQFARWFEHTVLKRRFVVKTGYLSSQDFWNHWKKIDQEKIDLIQERLLDKILPTIDLKELVFDPTNFTTYIEEHKEQAIMQFGHSKNGVKGVRQVNLALLVTKQEGVPVWHHTYNGNINDVTEFKEFINILTSRIAYFSKLCKNITLVLDKGNNSHNNIKNISAKLHFFVVGSLKPSENRELFEIPLEQFNEEYISAKGEKTFCTSLTKEVYDGKKKIVITYNTNLAYNQRVRTDKAIQKALNQLQNIKERLARSTKSRDEILLKVNSIVNKTYLNGLITYTLEETHDRLNLSFEKNEEAYQQKSKAFGKNILFTDNLILSTGDLVKLYRDKNIVEEQIKNLKDTHVISFTPMWCWTDHMIRVHAFTCIMALLFLRLLMKKINEAKLNLSQDETLDQLKKVKLALLKAPKNDKVTTKLTRLNDIQRELVSKLNLRRYL